MEKIYSFWNKIISEPVKDSVSDVVRCCEFDNKNIRHFICKLWDGVYLWGNDIHEQEIRFDQCLINGVDLILVNICLSGRCETKLESDTYVYMSPGLLNINTGSPKNGYSYPGSLYEGLEIAFDLNVIKDNCPVCIKELGLAEGIINMCNGVSGSHTAVLNPDVLEHVNQLYFSLKAGNLRLEEYRFLIVQLLYMLTHNGLDEESSLQYATKGQRRIALETEKIITRDLSRKFTIEEIASGFGVSPSALKKYFEMVYGLPVSRYLKAKRMEKAKSLLVDTDKSVKEIASICGYENQGKFGSAFKAYYGILPLEYRRLNYGCGN